MPEKFSYDKFKEQLRNKINPAPDTGNVLKTLLNKAKVRRGLNKLW